MGTRIQNGWLKSMYRAKDCDYSVTDLCMEPSQLWARIHTTYDEEKTEKVVGFKSFLGSALHKVIEDQDEDGVIKEFSWVRTLPDGTRIGGTADELRWRYSINAWRLGDVKLKGDYPTKKFRGIGTKADPKPKPEQEKEQLQMSIYRWLFDGMFNIEDKGVIYLFTPGHSAWATYPEYDEVWLDLSPVHLIDTYIKGKLKVAEAAEQPDNTCPKWLCNYCNFQEVCTHYKAPPEEDHKEFKDEN